MTLPQPDYTYLTTVFDVIFGNLNTFMAYLMGLVIAATVVNGLFRLFGHTRGFSVGGHWGGWQSSTDLTTSQPRDIYAEAQDAVDRREHQAEVNDIASIIERENYLDQQYEAAHPGHNRLLDAQYNDYLSNYNEQINTERQQRHDVAERTRQRVSAAEPSAERYTSQQNSNTDSEAENNPDYT